MFSKNMKSILIVTLLFVMSFVSVNLYADCDMFAGISKEGHYISWLNSKPGDLNDPNEFFEWLKIRSRDTTPKPNMDGYGILYYKDTGSFYLNPDSLGNNVNDPGSPINQAWYQENFNTYYTEGNADRKWELDTAQNAIMENSAKAAIVLAHARKGTGGIGNHPFWFNIDVGGIEKTYSFMHNGWLTSTLETPIFNYLVGSGWFNNNAHNSNWNNGSHTNMIDSEKFFHYIMKFVIANNGNIVAGIHDALTQTDISGTNINYHIEHPVQYYSYSMACSTYKKVINFVLTDGENLYIFRNSPSVDNAQTFNDSMHTLSYSTNDSFTAVKTYHELDTRVDQFDLVIIPRYGEPFEIPDFLDIPHSAFIHTDITSNQTWNEDKYISSDITISNNAEITLSNSASVKLIKHCKLTIENATVNIADNTQLQLYNSSQVLIDTGGLLFLNWGSTITGCTQTTYGATPPGQQVGGEPIITGDRIIAQNGGIITTDDNYLTPGDPIIISSSSGELWDGIFIQNPDEDINYWFVNCDISGIRKLSIANVGFSAGNTASLKLYQTDFHEAGQIIARNRQQIFIIGENSANRCNICNNHETPIAAYDSSLNIDYALIENNGRDIYGGLLNLHCDGIYLSYTADTGSEIINTIIQGNTGCGIQTYYKNVNIENNTIQYNGKHGLLTKTGTFHHLQNTTILNNLYAEYVSVQNSYNWPNMNNDIADLNGNSGGNDQYILMAYKWDGIPHSIDVIGNNINHENNEQRFFPTYDAFHFDSTCGITPEREMLYSALDEMRNDHYDIAETIFRQIIAVYPNTNEAATSIRGLFFVENYTDKNYPSLRSYIDNIQVSEETPLYKAKEDVKTKSYMKDKDYLTVIDRLETVINNSQIPDEIIMAMIDEGYCYMELSEGGERALPENCTVKTSTLYEYQDMVRELESQFSFYLKGDEQNTTPVAENILSLTNFPNPFNPITKISFDIASSSNVSINIYNVKGQKISTLADKHFENGSHTVIWNGTDSNKKAVASGIYFYKISTAKETQMKKMLLLK